MELVIAEKPSVARDLARVLGVRPQGKHAFEGERYTITWCIGHLVELEEPAAYDPAWRAWRLDRLPMLPEVFRLRGAKHALPQLRAVEKLLRDRAFAAAINACDAGREGELIFRYVYQHARSRLPIRRLWISSLTDEAIRRGFAALQPGRAYEDLADAARSRSEADWLVGMNATRALTARGREAGHDALYSIGRVQTPTLAMLVAREHEIAAFVPRDYWEVTAALRTDEGGAFTARWRHDKASRLGAASLADAIVARDAASDAPVVERVRARTVKEPPPQLFDLTSLQRTANRRFGFSAQRTLELAQALYEKHKLITYPRTDSRHLSADVAAELEPALAALAAVPAYAPFAGPLVASHPALGRRFVDDAKVSDHHAIIPTGTPIVRERLDRDEARIFDLIARRFLGAFLPDAEIAVTEAWIRVGPPTGAPPAGAADPELILDALPPPPDRYLARGRVRLVAGWQEVAGIGPEGPRRAPDRDDTGDDEPTGVLPRLVEGQRLAGTYASTRKQTSPPPRYSEATLLGAMESAGKAIEDETLRAAMRDTGLGTPATRASIIETLLRRDYIVRDGKWLVPTATGIGLIATIPVASLASPELTGRWEARLAAIARGTDRRDAFMADIRTYVTDIVGVVRGASPPGTGRPPLPGAANPPPSASSKPSMPGAPAMLGGPWTAGGPLRSSYPRGGGELARPERGQRRPRKPRRISGPGAKRPRDPSRDAVWEQMRANNPAYAKRARRSAGATAPKRSRVPGTSQRASASMQLTGEPITCPRCKQGALITGGRGWGCSRWREGCGFVVWFETAGRRLTVAQLRDLVAKGKTRKAAFAGGAGRLVLDAAAPGGARFEAG